MAEGSLFKLTVLPSWLACAPMLIALVALKFVELAPSGWPLTAMFTEATLAGLIGMTGAWFTALNKSERSVLRAKAGGKIPFLRRQPV